MEDLSYPIGKFQGNGDVRQWIDEIAAAPAQLRAAVKNLSPEQFDTPFTHALTIAGPLRMPIAHGEGCFVCRKEWILKGLDQAGQIVLRYDGLNPNGSQGDVAGLCDATGRVLGLMPHPERHVLPTQHPQWTRLGLAEEGDGMKLFRNAVDYFG